MKRPLLSPKIFFTALLIISNRNLQRDRNPRMVEVSFSETPSYLGSLNNLLKKFPNLLKDLTDQFQYNISDDYPVLKAFLERRREQESKENQEFYCILASKFKFKKSIYFFDYLLNGMVLDSILQLEQDEAALRNL